MASISLENHAEHSDDDSSLSELRSSMFDEITTPHYADDLAPTNDSTASSMNPQRPRKSVQANVWKEFLKSRGSELVIDKHGHALWYCLRCAHWPTFSAQRGREHLRNRHHIRVDLIKSAPTRRKEEQIDRMFGNIER